MISRPKVMTLIQRISDDTAMIFAFDGIDPEPDIHQWKQPEYRFERDQSVQSIPEAASSPGILVGGRRA
jgi:hypothetical protein